MTTMATHRSIGITVTVALTRLKNLNVSIAVHRDNKICFCEIKLENSLVETSVLSRNVKLHFATLYNESSKTVITIQ